jgi:hypothetical protein
VRSNPEKPSTLALAFESLDWVKLHAEKKAERDAPELDLNADSAASPAIQAESAFMVALVGTRMVSLAL